MSIDEIKKHSGQKTSLRAIAQLSPTVLADDVSIAVQRPRVQLSIAC